MNVSIISPDHVGYVDLLLKKKKRCLHPYPPRVL